MQLSTISMTVWFHIKVTVNLDRLISSDHHAQWLIVLLIINSVIDLDWISISENIARFKKWTQVKQIEKEKTDRDIKATLHWIKLAKSEKRSFQWQQRFSNCNLLAETLIHTFHWSHRECVYSSSILSTMTIKSNHENKKKSVKWMHLWCSLHVRLTKSLLVVCRRNDLAFNYSLHS